MKLKKYFYFLFLLTVLTLASSSYAATLKIVNNQSYSNIIYPSQWDAEVMDFTLMSESEDILQALTIKNLGNAPNDYIEKIVLYADDGDDYFEGWQKDIEIGEAVYYVPNQVWYWQDLNINIPKEGKRFFVTVETKKNGNITIDKRTIQMKIPVYYDDDSDGMFDYDKDLGIFMQSGNNGPEESIINSQIQTIYKKSSDSLPPVSIINYPVENQEITEQNITIKGMARDNGGSTPAAVYLTITDKINESIIADKISVTSVGSNYSTWEYYWNLSGLPDGEYELETASKDWINNHEYNGDVISVIVNLVPDQPEEPEQPDQPDQDQPEPQESDIPGVYYGDLIKASRDSVYYYGADGKRYVFPDQKTYMTWYDNFNDVKTITDQELASIPIGGNVTYKPGTMLIKITTDPKVYAVSSNGTLCWIESEELAIALYGENWGSLVNDVADPFFTNYTTGEPIIDTSDYDPESESSVSSINQDLGLL